MSKYYISLFLLLFSFQLQGIGSISIITDAANIANSVSGQSINDCVLLLQKACNCKVEVNNERAEVLLSLPRIDEAEASEKSAFAKGLDYPYIDYPPHHYRWSSNRIGAQIILELETPSYHGISCGLYGLLQEQLWFQFYHPKSMQLPNLSYWPLTEEFEWEAKPRFDKKGFHLHTMHPLEMTEPLLDHEYPNGLQEIRNYVDWLVRNQQNYFEFNLLESIDEKAWMPYIKEAVRYAKSRGLIVGVDLSLHMTQQKAYQLYETFPNSILPKKKQIEKRLDWLAQADWDVYNLEFSTTEYTQGNLKKKRELQLFVTNLITNKYGAKLMGREHVVRKDEMLTRKQQEDYSMNAEEKALDQHRGLLIHTVMFYTIFEENAPVYQNENLQHMLKKYKASVKERETWYYPESAYWITFDNSMPMTLLPYLSARLEDILFMDSLNCRGHITFSSGWEWGYWLIDWSIARWSWEHQFDGRKKEADALEYLSVLMQNDEWMTNLWSLLDLQEHYLKDKELMRYMAAASVPDELPEKFRSMEYQPRPTYTYRYYMKKAEPYQLDSLRAKGVEPLLEFADQADQLLLDLKSSMDGLNSTWQRLIAEEIWRGLQITSYRARHRALTLDVLIQKSYARLRKENFEDKDKLMEQAISIREKAQLLVRQQEEIYRYPLLYLSKAFQSHTAYDFGYLYTASNLHFWKREEDQIRNHRFGIFYQNIWDIPRILGIVD
jgi:hypothetical protein